MQKCEKKVGFEPVFFNLRFVRNFEALHNNFHIWSYALILRSPTPINLKKKDHRHKWQTDGGSTLFQIRKRRLPVQKGFRTIALNSLRSLLLLKTKF